MLRGGKTRLSNPDCSYEPPIPNNKYTHPYIVPHPQDFFINEFEKSHPQKTEYQRKAQLKNETSRDTPTHPQLGVLHLLKLSEKKKKGSRCQRLDLKKKQQP